MRTALLRTLLAALLLHGLFTVAVPAFLLSLSAGRLPSLAPTTPVGYLGVVVASLGLVLYARSAYELSMLSGVAAVPLGHSSSLRTVGLYGVVRNPLLLGVVILQLGEAAWFRSWVLLIYAVLYWLALHVLVVAVEEPRLAEAFGARFVDYCARVPRWVPRLQRLRHHPPAQGHGRGDGT